MSETPVENPPAPTEPPAAAATPPVVEPPKPTEPPANVWDNPDAARAEIERLRKENAKDRTNAKAQAGDDARKELAQTIAKALGLVEDEPIDPAALTEQLTTSQADAKQARVELAVWQAAAVEGVNGDPVALLDSTSFLASLKDIDPSDSAAIAAAIATAVENNPRLAAAPTVRPPAPNPAQGAGSNGTALGGLDAQIAAAEKARDFQTAIALKQQRSALLTQKS